MKIKIHRKDGSSIFFVYEDYDGRWFGNYADLERDGRKPFSLIGYIDCPAYGVCEAIDLLELDRRPTVGEVRALIGKCWNY